MNKLTFIEEVRTENTGGGVMVDFVTLENGYLIAVSCEMIGIYKSLESFDNGDEPLTHFLT